MIEIDWARTICVKVENIISLWEQKCFGVDFLVLKFRFGNNLYVKLVIFHPVSYRSLNFVIEKLSLLTPSP